MRNSVFTPSNTPSNTLLWLTVYWILQWNEWTWLALKFKTGVVAKFRKTIAARVFPLLLILRNLQNHHILVIFSLRKPRKSTFVSPRHGSFSVTKRSFYQWKISCLSAFVFKIRFCICDRYQPERKASRCALFCLSQINLRPLLTTQHSYWPTVMTSFRRWCQISAIMKTMVSIFQAYARVKWSIHSFWKGLRYVVPHELVLLFLGVASFKADFCTL